MSILSITAALEKAADAIRPRIDTAWENVDFIPTPGKEYQKVNFLFPEPENLEYGANYRQNGIMQISLFYPLQAGSGEAIKRAELIRATFKRGNTYTKDSINVIIQKTPEIGSGNVDGDRWMIPIKIRFYANLTA